MDGKSMVGLGWRFLIYLVCANFLRSLLLDGGGVVLGRCCELRWLYSCLYVTLIKAF